MHHIGNWLIRTQDVSAMSEISERAHDAVFEFTVALVSGKEIVVSSRDKSDLQLQQIELMNAVDFASVQAS